MPVVGASGKKLVLPLPSPGEGIGGGNEARV